MASGKSDDRNGSELEGAVYEQTPPVHIGTHENRHKRHQKNRHIKEQSRQLCTSVPTTTSIEVEVFATTTQIQKPSAE